MMTTPAAVLVTEAPIHRVTVLVADRPRAIDTVIDYFGDPPRSREASLSREIADRW
jgi:hypothetical protein